MSRPLIEVFKPELVGDEWRAAAQINFSEGPVRLYATAPAPLIARYLARLQAHVAIRELGELGGGGAVAGTGDYWGGVDRTIAGRAKAARLARHAAEGDAAALARIDRVYQAAQSGYPGAIQAAEWIAAARRGHVGCGGVGCVHVGAERRAPHPGRAGKAMSQHDLELLLRARALRRFRRGVRRVA